MPENNFENNDAAGRDLNPEARSHEAAGWEVRETADTPAGSTRRTWAGRAPASCWSTSSRTPRRPP